MKTIIKYISLVIFLVLTACEDVVDIDVQEGPTRLVIEASLD